MKIKDIEEESIEKKDVENKKNKIIKRKPRKDTIETGTKITLQLSSQVKAKYSSKQVTIDIGATIFELKKKDIRYNRPTYSQANIVSFYYSSLKS